MTFLSAACHDAAARLAEGREQRREHQGPTSQQQLQLRA